MHRHATAAHERRPEEPEQDAFDERRHERGRSGAACARPDRTPESTRANSDDADAGAGTEARLVVAGTEARHPDVGDMARHPEVEEGVNK